MDKCEKCLYKENCQFLATHKKAIIADCTAYKDATNVVEVVRCKNCKYFDDEDFFCIPIGCICKPDDYCSFAKMKGGK